MPMNKNNLTICVGLEFQMAIHIKKGRFTFFENFKIKPKAPLKIREYRVRESKPKLDGILS